MLAVGKELLIGRTLNTNAYWIGRRLARMGSMLKEVTVVDDDLDEISAALRETAKRSPDVLVVVGGLGPTPDDMTLRGIAKGLGASVRRNPGALKMIREHYAKRGLGGIELTPARIKMSMLPAGADPVLNPVGTAPGVRLTMGKTVVYCLPGVPVEMRAIFRSSVEPEVQRILGRMHRKYITLKIEGVFESTLAPTIAQALRRHPGAYIKSHPRGVKEGVSQIELDIAVVGEERSPTEVEGEKIAEEIAGEVERAGGAVKRFKVPRG